jgi:quinol monooxygenase YgiN
MFGLIAKIKTSAGQRDALIAVLLEGTESMPGCHSYVVSKDRADPAAIWITEVWRDREAHRASLALASVQQAIARARPLIAAFGERFETEPIGGLGLSID